MEDKMDYKEFTQKYKVGDKILLKYQSSKFDPFHIVEGIVEIEPPDHSDSWFIYGIITEKNGAKGGINRTGRTIDLEKDVFLISDKYIDDYVYDHKMLSLDKKLAVLSSENDRLGEKSLLTNVPLDVIQKILSSNPLVGGKFKRKKYKTRKVSKPMRKKSKRKKRKYTKRRR